jgi:hypothetical protein
VRRVSPASESGRRRGAKRKEKRRPRLVERLSASIDADSE